MKRLISSIPDDEPITVHKLTCISGLDHRTINKYVDLIIEIQEARKVVKQPKGMRLVIRKGHHPNMPQPQAYDTMLLKNPARGD